jgi:hypothetical protein
MTLSSNVTGPVIAKSQLYLRLAENLVARKLSWQSMSAAEMELYIKYLYYGLHDLEGNPIVLYRTIVLLDATTQPGAMCVYWNTVLLDLIRRQVSYAEFLLALQEPMVEFTAGPLAIQERYMQLLLDAALQVNLALTSAFTQLISSGVLPDIVLPLNFNQPICLSLPATLSPADPEPEIVLSVPTIHEITCFHLPDLLQAILADFNCYTGSPFPAEFVAEMQQRFSDELQLAAITRTWLQQYYAATPINL